MFATSETYPADLGGLTGADQICQTHGDALDSSVTWVALLSSGTFSAPIHARDRITVAKNVVNAQCELLAFDQADLWDGALANPIKFNELKEVIDDPTRVLLFPFSASESNGELNATGVSCESWTSEDGALGSFNTIRVEEAAWIGTSTTACNAKRGLVCVSQ